MLSDIVGEFGLQTVGCYVATDEPSTSGLQENDYPVLSDDRVGLAALKEIGCIKRLPLPPELAERFACILYWQQLVAVAVYWFCCFWFFGLLICISLPAVVFAVIMCTFILFVFFIRNIGT